MQQSVRARSIGGILDDVFRQYRLYFVPLFLISLVFLAPFTILEAIIGSSLPSFNYQQLLSGKETFAQAMAQMQSHPGALSAQWTVIAVSLLISLISVNVISPLTEGTYYLLGTDTLIHNKLRFSVWTFLRQALRRWGAYLATLWLLIGLGAAVLILMGAVAVGIGLLTAVLAHNATGILILIAILLYLALIGALVYFSIRLLFVYVCVFTEKLRNWGAIKRSWQLTADSFWRIFGTSLVAYLILGFASSGISFVINFALPTTALRLLGSGIIAILLAPLFHLLIANLYIDLRIRRDGYDIELQSSQEA